MSWEPQTLIPTTRTDLGNFTTQYTYIQYTYTYIALNKHYTDCCLVGCYPYTKRQEDARNY